jgi:hypothetical protein
VLDVENGKVQHGDDKDSVTCDVVVQVLEAGRSFTTA